MKDGIIKGTGNSRNLKSAIPADITHEQLVQMLINGTFPIDLNGINPEGWQQIGNALNKDTLLSDVAAEVVGLSEEQATPSNAFLKLAIPAGKFAFGITVKCEGIPVEGVILHGLKNTQGETAVTNQNGFAFGYTNTSTLTITISDYVDLNDFAGKFYKDTDTVTAIKISLTKKVVQEFEIESSRDVRLSNLVREYDLFAIGGGGSGASAYERDNYGSAGGGGSGYTCLLRGRSVDFIETLTIIIGSGGHSVSANDSSYGRDGGKTSVSSNISGTLLSAKGGIGGFYGKTGARGGNGGSGAGGAEYDERAYDGGSDGSDGSGPYGGKGQGTTTRKWHEPNGELFCGAGGGAAHDAIKNAGRGGSGGGGDGIYSYDENYSAKDGSKYGSGGGAICAHHYGAKGHSGAGHSGAVFIRWRYAA